MNDTRLGHDGARSIAPMVGFALGALAGAGLALLLAPASGEDTRRRLGNAAQRMSRDARRTVDEARESVSDAASGLGEGLKAAVNEGVEAFRHDSKPLVAHPVSRITQTLTPPPPRTS